LLLFVLDPAAESVIVIICLKPLPGILQKGLFLRISSIVISVASNFKVE
jgi:hypothetical protein